MTWLWIAIETSLTCAGVLLVAIWGRRTLLRSIGATIDDVEEAAFKRGFKAGYDCGRDCREVWAPDGELITWRDTSLN